MCVMYMFTPTCILDCTYLMFTLYVAKIIYPVNVLVLHSGDISLGSIKNCSKFMICNMFVGLIIQSNFFKAATLRDETTGHLIEVAV